MDRLAVGSQNHVPLQRLVVPARDVFGEALECDTLTFEGGRDGRILTLEEDHALGTFGGQDR
jgi:hypothetical protein